MLQSTSIESGTPVFSSFLDHSLDPTRYSYSTEHQLLSSTLVTCLLIVLIGHPHVPVSRSALPFLTRTLSRYSLGNIHGPDSFYNVPWPSSMTWPLPCKIPHSLITVTTYTALFPFYHFLWLFHLWHCHPKTPVYILAPVFPCLFSFFSSRFFYTSTRHLLS